MSAMMMDGSRQLPLGWEHSWAARHEKYNIGHTNWGHLKNKTGLKHVQLLLSEVLLNLK